MGIKDFFAAEVRTDGPWPGSYLRRFDRAMQQLLCERAGEILVRDMTIAQVKIVRGTPQRAWSIVTEALKKTGDKRQPAATDESRPVLPMISFYRRNVTEDAAKRHHGHYRRWVKAPRPDGKSFEVAAKYKPLLIEYEVDFWTKLDRYKDMFIETLSQTFDPYDQVQFDGTGSTIQVRMDGGVSDLSDLEDVGEKDRLLRAHASFVMEGFLPRTPQIVQSVQRVFATAQAHTVRTVNADNEVVIRVERLEPSCVTVESPGVELIVTYEDLDLLTDSCIVEKKPFGDCAE